MLKRWTILFRIWKQKRWGKFARSFNVLSTILYYVKPWTLLTLSQLSNDIYSNINLLHTQVIFLCSCLVKFFFPRHAISICELPFDFFLNGWMLSLYFECQHYVGIGCSILFLFLCMYFSFFLIIFLALPPPTGHLILLLVFSWLPIIFPCHTFKWRGSRSVFLVWETRVCVSESKLWIVVTQLEEHTCKVRMLLIQRSIGGWHAWTCVDNVFLVWIFECVVTG